MVYLALMVEKIFTKKCSRVHYFLPGFRCAGHHYQDKDLLSLSQSVTFYLYQGMRKRTPQTIASTILKMKFGAKLVLFTL